MQQITVKTEAELRQAIGSDRVVSFVGDPLIELGGPLVVEGCEKLCIVGPATIARNTVVFERCHDVRIHSVRFRLGDEAGPVDCSTAIGCDSLVYDHCSFAWSVDELVTLTDCIRSSIRSSILAYPLHNSVHPKGAHGLGPILQGYDLTLRDSLVTQCMWRPEINGTALIMGCVFHAYKSSWPIIVQQGFAVVGDCEFSWANIGGRAIHLKPGATVSEVKNRLRETDLVADMIGSAVISVSPSWNPLVETCGCLPHDGVDDCAIQDYKDHVARYIDKPSDLPGGWDLLK